MLWHYANGRLPNYLEKEGGSVGWMKYSHRGVQLLDRIHIGKKQRRDVFRPQFEIRYNTAFEQVVLGCAALTRGPDNPHTWIAPLVIEGFLRLHELGFAHSFETWQGNDLVGGAFGVQIGAIMSVESMFHRVDQASKAAYVRTLLHLREQGFQMVDVNHASEFFQRFGAEDVRQWRFEEMLRRWRCVGVSVVEGHAPPRLPWGIRAALPAAQITRSLKRRLEATLHRLSPAPDSVDPDEIDTLTIQ
jgi:leucyl/phenylalanyl-tRNA--protein transferase